MSDQKTLNFNYLSPSVAKDIIDLGLSMGANFVDLFIEKNHMESLTYKSQVIKNIQNGIDFGIGIRLIFGTKALYGYTNSDNRDDLIHLVKNLGSYYETHRSQHLTFDNFSSLQYKIIPYSQSSQKSYDLAQKVEKIRKLDSLIREKSKLVSQVSISTLLRSQEVEIYNSEGLYAKEFRPYVRFMTDVITQDGPNQGTGSWYPGARGLWDYVDRLDLKEIAEKSYEQARIMLTAAPCPAGKMPVVIDNGFGGVIFHEACGHLLETTSVEKKSSVLWDKKGELVAHPNLSAVDDGTIEGEWGSLSIDDEGMPTQKTQLIKDGVLTNFLCDRLGHLKTDHPRTGSGRRQSYKFAPASRMRNTFIESGKYQLEDLLKSMGDGLYAKSMGGGSVNPGTGEFNFSVREGYLVKDGKITSAVKGATLIGTGEEILKKISMTANNFSLATGMCGSVSGSIPTTVGQPAIKVDDILVGGAA